MHGRRAEGGGWRQPCREGGLSKSVGNSNCRPPEVVVCLRCCLSNDTFEKHRNISNLESHDELSNLLQWALVFRVTGRDDSADGGERQAGCCRRNAIAIAARAGDQVAQAIG